MAGFEVTLYGRIWVTPKGSVALVVVGISGELYIDWESGDLQTQLRSANGSLVLLLEKEAGAAKDSADAAATSADRANAAAKDAQGKAESAGAKAVVASTAAGAANRHADEVAEKLTAANAEIARLQNQRVELDKSLYPRVLWVPQEQFKNLRTFAGTKVIMRYLPDAEAERAASSLIGALTQAGWEMTQAIPDPTANTPVFDGVVVYSWWFSDSDITIKSPGLERLAQIRGLMNKKVAAERPAKELVDFLEAHNWEARTMPGPPPGSEVLSPNTLEIVIGFKPNPYFDPEQIKRANTEIEQNRKRELEFERKMEQREKELTK